MNKTDEMIHEAISKLKNERKIFHSEDDLKFAFSHILIQINPNLVVRLEKPEGITMIKRDGSQEEKRVPIDILLINNNKTIPIELKYKTSSFPIVHNSEQYTLTNHGATDIGRYSFRKDIYRVEQYIGNNKESNVGYVLIISNEKDYWNDVSNKEKLDSNFSFHNGAIIEKKDKSWNYNAIDKNKYSFIENENKWKYKTDNKDHWTCKGEQFYKLDLKNQYKVIWNDYSEFGKSNFKYCLIQVKK